MLNYIQKKPHEFQQIKPIFFTFIHFINGFNFSSI